MINNIQETLSVSVSALAISIAENTLDQQSRLGNNGTHQTMINNIQETLSVSVSALATSVAGIITTIIIGTWKAIFKGAQATGKFAKAVYNLGKKLGPLLALLLNIVAQAIS